MRKVFHLENILYLALCLLGFQVALSLGFLTYGYYEYDLKKKIDLNQYIHVSADISRHCLAQCKGKMVAGFGSVDEKLQCFCEELKK